MYEKEYTNLNSAILGTVDCSLTRPFLGCIKIDVINQQQDLLTNFAWRIKGTQNWRKSGYIETNLIVGHVYEIEFKNVERYDTPDNIFVRVIYNGGVVVRNVYYIPIMGQLQINIMPNTPNIFQWKLKNSLIWRNSGDIIDMQIGQYEIEFSDVENFNKPDNINVVIEYNNLSVYNAIYEAHVGCIQVVINPNTEDVFQWKLTNSSIWHNSGVLVEVPIGEYEIEFKNVDEYQKPDNIIVIVTYAMLELFKVDYEYVICRGSLIIYLSPNMDGIFQWRRKDTLDWKNSNSLEYNLLAGTYEIEFKDVDNYLTPSNIFVTIIENELVEEYVEYV